MTVRLCIGPHSIKKREEYGHYEIDTIWSNRSSNACLLTIIERKTRYLYGCRLSTRRSEEVCQAIIDLMCDLNPKTITVDRGKEFSMYLMLEKSLNCRVYFSDLGCPYQRGSIENANGLLRQYFPKGTDFNKVTDKAVKKAIDEINNRPRRIFDYLSSYEVLEATIAPK